MKLFLICVIAVASMLYFITVGKGIDVSNNVPGLSGDHVVSENPVISEKKTQDVNASVEVDFYSHKVRKKETLADIGLAYGVPWKKIARLNGFKVKNPNRIFPNQHFLIPRVLVQRVELGEASIYGNGDGFHGRKTATGEIFDRNKKTAAHRTLPFNTIVEVTNLANGKKVIVRINDWGPARRFKGRIIDLSLAAAKEISMVAKGVQEVKVKVIKLGCKYCKFAS